MSYFNVHPETTATLNKDAGISLVFQIHKLQRSFHKITEMLPQQSQHDSVLHSHQKRVNPYLIKLAAVNIIGDNVGTCFEPYSQAEFNAFPLHPDVDAVLHVDDKHHHLLENLNKQVNSPFQVLSIQDIDYKNFDNHITIWNKIIRHLDRHLNQNFVTQLQHCCVPKWQNSWWN
jgi:hypothetical protein